MCKQIVLLLCLSQLVSEFLTKLYLLSCYLSLVHTVFSAPARPSSSRVTYSACETWFSWMSKRSTRNLLDGSGFEFWSVEFYNFNLLVGSSHNNFPLNVYTTTIHLWVRLIADAKNPIRTFITNSWLWGCVRNGNWNVFVRGTFVSLHAANHVVGNWC